MAFVFPFYWMIITSFKTFSETIVFPPTLWPKEFIWSNYRRVWESAPFWLYAKNSVVVTLGIILLQMSITIPAAYGFAKFEFPFKGVLFAIVLLAFMIPSNVTFISVYLLMSKWGLLRTLLPQILPHGASAFSIFLLRQSFMQIPQELIESARLDGANELSIIHKIMLPMSKPALVTIALFSFIGHWNSYFWPLVMTDTVEVRPLPIAVAMLRHIEGSLNWELIMAGNVILVVPIIIMYFLMRKRILEAFVYHGIK